MGDPTRGLYTKFLTERTDGESAPGGTHEGCQYFVLDMDHDPYALPALQAYAAACASAYPLLARDLSRITLDMQSRRDDPHHPAGPWPFPKKTPFPKK